MMSIAIIAIFILWTVFGSWVQERYERNEVMYPISATRLREIGKSAFLVLRWLALSIIAPPVFLAGFVTRAAAKTFGFRVPRMFD